MATARVRLPGGLGDLLLAEMETCITQSNFGRDDTLIAKRYLIDHWPQIEIAAELGWDRSTVSKRVSYILRKTLLTAQKLNFL